MIINNKFEIGEKVYYWSNENSCVKIGIILKIKIEVYKDDSREKVLIRYYMKEYDKSFSFGETVPENLIFRRREDVFDFCMEFTKNV